MHKEFSTTRLGEWISNFNPNDAVPFVTSSGLIELKELEAFIAKIKEQKADCVRVYFIRLRTNETPPTATKLVSGALAKGCKWHNASDQLTQATIALVPAKNFNVDGDQVFSADDIIVGGAVTTLMPGLEPEGTGLNPPSSTGTHVTVGGH